MEYSAFIGRVFFGVFESFVAEVGFLFGFGEGALDRNASGAAMGVLMIAPILWFLGSVVSSFINPRLSLSRLDAIQQRAFGHVSAMAIVALGLSMAYEVFSRYALGRPTIWSFELSYMLMGSAFVLTMAYCMQQDQHVRVDIFYHRLSRRHKAMVDIVGLGLLSPMLAWMLTGLIDHFHESYVIGETTALSAWDPPVWPFNFVLVVAFETFFLQVLLAVLQNCATLVRKHGVDD